MICALLVNPFRFISQSKVKDVKVLHDFKLLIGRLLILAQILWLLLHGYCRDLKEELENDLVVLPRQKSLDASYFIFRLIFISFTSSQVFSTNCFDDDNVCESFFFFKYRELKWGGSHKEWILNAA